MVGHFHAETCANTEIEAFDFVINTAFTFLMAYVVRIPRFSEKTEREVRTCVGIDSTALCTAQR